MLLCKYVIATRDWILIRESVNLTWFSRGAQIQQLFLSEREGAWNNAIGSRFTFIVILLMLLMLICWPRRAKERMFILWQHKGRKMLFDVNWMERKKKSAQCTFFVASDSVMFGIDGEFLWLFMLPVTTSLLVLWFYSISCIMNSSERGLDVESLEISKALLKSSASSG